MLSNIPKPWGTDVRSSNLTPLLHCAMCQHVECLLLLLLLPFFFLFLCHLLNVGACIRHIAREGQVEWTPLVWVTGEQIQIVLTSLLCYSILAYATLIS